jgi:acetyltransferase
VPAKKKRTRSSLDKLFRPRAVAVIGASRREGSIGREVLRNLVDGGFAGKVFPVNPNTDVVHSIKCHRSLAAIPDPVDLAVIVVPKQYVAKAMRECARKGVGGVVVITAGFKETGEEGATACAWSARTAWASRTPRPPRASTRRSRALSRRPGRSRS